MPSGAQSVLLEALRAPPAPPTPFPKHVLKTLHSALTAIKPGPYLTALLVHLSTLPVSAIPHSFVTSLADVLLSLSTSHTLTIDQVTCITKILTLQASRNSFSARVVHARHAYQLLAHRYSSPSLSPFLNRLSAMTHPPYRRKRPLRILSIDGGGTRAVLSLELLTILSTRLGPLHRNFDYIIGTSSGGVITLALGLLQLPPREVQMRYKQLSKTLFRKRARGLIGRGLYDGEIVTQFAREVCKERRLCDVDSNIKVGVVSAVAGGVLPYLHTNYRSHGRYTWSGCHKLVDVIRATTAAPVLFEVYQAETGERFVDGGVVCNNPTAVGVHECMTLFPGCELGCVVSVGSGKMEMFGGGLVKALLWRMTDTEILHHVLEDVLTGYYRLNCDINRTGLDVSGGVLEELIVIARRWGEGEGRQLLDELCSYLESLRNHLQQTMLSRL